MIWSHLFGSFPAKQIEMFSDRVSRSNIWLLATNEFKLDQAKFPRSFKTKFKPKETYILCLNLHKVLYTRRCVKTLGVYKILKDFSFSCQNTIQ